jgi:hypothetical protein
LAVFSGRSSFHARRYTLRQQVEFALVCEDRGNATDVIGYAWTLAWGRPEDTEPELQLDPIRAWSEDNRHRMICTLHDETTPQQSGLARRLELARGLEMVRDGVAGGVVVARLDRLAPDVIRQERVIDEVRRCGGRVFSASPGEDGLLTEESTDPVRSLIRRVLAGSDAYQQDLRELRISREVRRTGLPGDRYKSALARIDELSRSGVSPRGISEKLRSEGYSPRHSLLFGQSRLRLLVGRSGPPGLEAG